MRGANPGAALDAEVLRQEAFAPGSIVVVACSGGPDSVALAALMERLAPRLRVTPLLAHVNHGLRPSALQDECVVLSVAARLHLDVRVAAVAPAGTDEAALREVRYAALAAIAHAAGAAAVVTAHTAEDQAETVLLALFRGTGPSGLGGIAPRRELAPGIALVRPLLRVERERLHAELHASALPYARDPSNADPRYRRNALRAALAGLRAEFPHLDAAVARCAEIVRDEREAVPRAALRARVRERLADEGGLRDVSLERIEAVLRAIERGGPARVHVKEGTEWHI
jgi:tRNA(Ile)-lysidine synthase